MLTNIIRNTLLFLTLLLNSCGDNKKTIEDNATQNKIAFWNHTKRGTNIFNDHISREDIQAAKAYEIKFVRICLDKFPSKQRYFLIGDVDSYDHLVKEDLVFLKQILDMFNQENMPVVITMLSLPGSCWKQLNNGVDDLRIWKDAKFQQQAARFWGDLAKELRSYSIVVGYNILNEPHPERLFDSKNCHIENVNQVEIQKLLFEFYDLIVKNIRKEDKCTPIIIDSSCYAEPNTFKKLHPINDSYIIYSFHMYEPYEYTNHKQNGGKYLYPGKIRGKHWNKKTLKQYMNAVETFQKRYKIASNRILVGEFGCYRKQKGLPQYFSDLIDIFEENKWHWAFYAFRDNWDGMDYELGDKPLPWSYWKAQERDEKFQLNRNKNAPQFYVLKTALRSIYHLNTHH
jgi:hypothetical protein